MLPRNSSVVETICPTRGETGSLFCYSFCSGENTCKFLETECKILTSSFQHSSLAETCEVINDNLLPSDPLDLPLKKYMQILCIIKRGNFHTINTCGCA